MTETMAILPARGTSKRLPRKNILPLCGHPMIYYPVRAADESGLFDRIIVSSEDEEILEVAAETGAEQFRRPAELSSDETRVVEVVIHVLDTLRMAGCEPDVFCVIYPTAVLIQPGDLQGGYELLLGRTSADVVMAVSEYDRSPYLALKEEEGYLHRMWPEYIGKYRWELPRLLSSTGTFYWARTESFRHNPSFYTERTVGYYIPALRAVDIDTETDYRLAELIMANGLNRLHDERINAGV